MPEYICSSCGTAFEAEPDQNGQIVCTHCKSAMAEKSASRPLPAGSKVGGYEIIRHIAAGGTGSVYLAEQIAMERTVALKILNPDQISRENADRFLEEARNTAKFENQHVVSVIDTGISPEGHYYIAMQYVEGETLEEILQRGRAFSEEETLMIGITIAEALRSIWNKYKMLHKDIKPGNIMLTPENEAMLLDMGTAQERGASRLTDGNIEGSPYYMSPEQARGDALTESTDLYSLGATMYQMVTGKYLYDGPDLESILRQHESAPFPDPAVRVPEMHVSEKMTAILRKMLEKRPQDRYSSWEDFIRDAKKLLGKILEKKGAAVSGKLQQKYMELESGGIKRRTTVQNPPSTLRFICFSLVIFILAAGLLGGIFFYLAVQKNSSNARLLLEPIRKQTGGLQMDPDAAEEAVKKAEPYFRRIGVLPSLRQELEKCRLKISEYRTLVQKEEKLITDLESQTAEQLKLASEEEEKAREAIRQHDPKNGFKHFRQSSHILRTMSEKIKKTHFVLQPNLARADVLVQRLRLAQNAIFREIRLLRRPRPVVRPRPRPSEKKPVKKPVPARKPTENPPDRRQILQKQYSKVLEMEKNRIRLQLLTRTPAAKTVMPEVKVSRKMIPESNRPFDQWYGRMKKLNENAAKVWNAIYDSHQKLAGFYFTVPVDGKITRMELRTIIRDEVVLYHPGMPNVRLAFNRLQGNEWLAFLNQTARKNGLQKELEGYLLLDGWFMAAGKSKDAFIRQEMPVMRKLYFDFLTSGKAKLTESDKSFLINKYKADPVFVRYRTRLEQSIGTRKEPGTQERKQ